MDRARSMLREKNLSNDYWAKAVHCATYILNRCPTKEIMNKVLEEAWSGTKQGVTYMKVFWMCGLCTHSRSTKEKVGQQRGEICFHWIQ